MKEDRGLDLTRVGATSDQEKAAFQRFYAKNLGRSHPGLDFWLEPAPDVLKRYRAFATAMNPGGLEGPKLFLGFAFLPSYALSGYTEGVRYIIRLWQEQRLTKAQVLEGLAIGFIHIGPRGMETVVDALEGYEWLSPTEPAKFPDGWTHDPDAFRSGLDFSRAELMPTEAESLRGWYLRTLGEVPRYVTFLLRYRHRDAAKAGDAVHDAARDGHPGIGRRHPRERPPGARLRHDKGVDDARHLVGAAERRHRDGEPRGPRRRRRLPCLD